MASDRGSLPIQDSTGNYNPERVDSVVLSSGSSEAVDVTGQPDNDAEPALDLASIKTTGVEPSETPDALTIKQLLGFTLKQRIEYEHIKLVERLDEHLQIVRSERDDHKNHCAAQIAKYDALVDRLHNEELEHVQLKTTRRGDRCKDAVFAVMSVLGGALISTFPKGSGWFAFGWSILGLAALLQMMRAAVNVP